MSGDSTAPGDRNWLERFAGLRLLVAGDIMLDEYLLGRAERVSPEAPVPVVHLERDEHRLGGAGNVVANLRALECSVEVAGVTGADAAGDRLRELLAGIGVDATGLVADRSRPTVQKVRVVAQGHQMIRYDRERTGPVSAEVEAGLWERIEERFASCDAVVLSDYAKGTLTAGILRRIADRARMLGKRVVADPKGTSYDRYRGLAALTPNESEACVAAGVQVGCSDDELLRLGRELIKDLGLEALCVTRGPKGVLLVLADGTSRTLPTAAVEVFDVTGAGDTFLAAFAAALAAGAPWEESARLGNKAAGIAVGKRGTATVSRAELEHALRDLDVVGSIEEIGAWSLRQRERGRTVVLAFGDFARIGLAEVRFLEQARALGDALVVGLRPCAGAAVGSEPERAAMLGALHAVDHVVVCGDEELPRLVGAVQPAVVAASERGSAVALPLDLAVGELLRRQAGA